MKTRELKESEVEFTLECLPEETPIEGNALVSGDDEQDRAHEQWVRDQLESGNEWAWCTVKVTARFNGFEGSDYLGCCSYLSERDFCEVDGYYPQMREEALSRLNEEIARIDARIPHADSVAP